MYFTIMKHADGAGACILGLALRAIGILTVLDLDGFEVYVY